jgi:putative ATPase
VRRAVVDPRGLGDRVVLDDEALATIVRLASGDARRALTALEASAQSAAATTDEARAARPADPSADAGADYDPDADYDDEADADTRPVITAETVAQSVDRALLRYDRNGDEHYDVISAFIKSVRGSDVDAALHYLARMIEAGEDPRFICRRIIVSAGEDIGMADPNALTVAVSAATAVQMIGMPEGRIPMAEAVVYLATAPKSNRSYSALDAAIADVRSGAAGRVPKHLRDAHYPGAKRLGHGKGYKYAHDSEFGVVEQQYLPDELVGRTYYDPTANGNERDVAARLEKLRRITRGS